MQWSGWPRRAQMQGLPAGNRVGLTDADKVWFVDLVNKVVTATIAYQSDKIARQIYDKVQRDLHRVEGPEVFMVLDDLVEIK